MYPRPLLLRLPGFCRRLPVFAKGIWQGTPFARNRTHQVTGTPRRPPFENWRTRTTTTTTTAASRRGEQEDEGQEEGHEGTRGSICRPVVLQQPASCQQQQQTLTSVGAGIRGTRPTRPIFHKAWAQKRSLLCTALYALSLLCSLRALAWEKVVGSDGGRRRGCVSCGCTLVCSQMGDRAG